MPNSLIPRNNLKQGLKEGRSFVGMMLVEVRQPSIMQVLANSGFQFILIDGEHGPFNIETIADLCRAARAVGVTPIVRIPEITYAHITQPLDAGAQGIMVPRITGAQQVHEVVEIMKYPPLGKRGSVVGRGHTDFKSGPILEAMKAANEESLLVVQIENKQALENLDAILSVPGVDIALVGPTDLSVSLDVGGDMNSPVLNSAIERVLAACNEHSPPERPFGPPGRAVRTGRAGIIPAIHINDLDRATSWASQGMRMISFNSEIGLLASAGSGATGAIRKAFKV